MLIKCSYISIYELCEHNFFHAKENKSASLSLSNSHLTRILLYQAKQPGKMLSLPKA